MVNSRGTRTKTSTWIALFRGINVGGRNVLPMKELVRDLRSLKLENIRTYIQSGNVVFQASGASRALADEIAALIEKRHGFRPRILILSAEQFNQVVASNPFPEAEAQPKTLHLFFLASPPTAPDVEALRQAESPSEQFHLTDQVFYLHAPDGIGRSKLASQAEKYLGVAATARNWRTVQKLQALVEDS